MSMFQAGSQLQCSHPAAAITFISCWDGLLLQFFLCVNIHSLSGRIGKVVASHVAVARSIPLRCTDLYYERGAQGVQPMRVKGATSQLDLPSLTPLSVAGCG